MRQAHRQLGGIIAWVADVRAEFFEDQHMVTFFKDQEWSKFLKANSIVAIRKKGVKMTTATRFKKARYFISAGRGVRVAAHLGLGLVALPMMCGRTLGNGTSAS